MSSASPMGRSVACADATGRGLVLSLFDYTGNMVKPWADAGFDTLCVDLLHSYRKPEPGTMAADLMTVGPLLVGLAERDYSLSDIVMLFGFPVCTDVANSGNRDKTAKGLRALARSVDMFATCREFSSLVDCPFMFENPVGSMATYWRKPDHYFHPGDYADWEPQDNYTKYTSLWTGNGFVMPPEARGDHHPPMDDRIHKAPPGTGRAGERSVTPMGFSKATFAANYPVVARQIKERAA